MIKIIEETNLERTYTDFDFEIYYLDENNEEIHGELSFDVDDFSFDSNDNEYSAGSVELHIDTEFKKEIEKCLDKLLKDDYQFQDLLGDIKSRNESLAEELYYDSTSGN